jgi:hypothetical protein
MTILGVPVRDGEVVVVVVVMSKGEMLFGW